MRLIIAEKPSLGRAIADVLPKPHKKHEGYIETAQGDYVTWCVGHLLEQAEPDQYDPAFKQWKLEHLPIVPQQWQLKPRKGVSKQLSVIRKLMKTADTIVHAGDPDREGQLLVDEVLDYLKLSATRKKQVRRLLVNDLNASAVKRALQRLQDNSHFIPLSVSALARSRADWLYGINLTRAYTVLGRKSGYNGLLSIGRVQTPVLGLVVQRDEERENFVAKPFYDLFAQLNSKDNTQFRAKWQPSEACQPWMDEDGRVLDRRLAENVAGRIKGKAGEISKALNKQGKELPPLPYSLSSLQIDAAKQLKMNAKETLDVCQKLYEKKLVTYPRSDCRYLPVEHWQESPEVLAAIRSNDESLSKAVDQALPERKSKAWNDKKVGAHHAIIPTSRRTDLFKLDTRQRQLYSLIARQYVAQFYDDHRFTSRRLEVLIEGGLFVAKSRQTVQEGWKALFVRPGKEQGSDSSANGDEREASNAFLPDLSSGDLVQCIDAEIKDKMTQPPKAFTDATLLSAMTGIARFVKDPEVRKILKETDGLGTEATRAGIIELLFNRQFLTRQGKEIHATTTGKALIRALPDAVGQPDMTAQWESALNDIVERKGTYAGFMGNLDNKLRGLLTQALSEGGADFSQLPQGDGSYRKNYRKKSYPRKSASRRRNDKKK
ncbi:DNA topoisomerase III [Endozoicomonas euniceicola]|uniref:DNA topoisomerase 3 n=1 Tax=Endozoicomonas euniceicola TaxID=1234143 RepID=A0ABY6GSE7_9GAMM|nr:DNA topoisomerase III [Endozoicomonas euniceicola]UYM15339.1 DNA topoisomerase III [Endozoicomonas euniceicola]